MARVNWLLAGILGLGIWGGLRLPVLANGPGNQGLWWSLMALLRDGNASSEVQGSGQPVGAQAPVECLLGPAAGETLWSLSPLIAGQGAVSSVALRRADSQEVLWQTRAIPVLAGEGEPTFVVAYGGPPLWPGDRYEWVITRPATTALNRMTTAPFRVMPRGAVRDRITAELIALGQDDTRIPMAIARAQAQVFLSNQLMTDALQVALSPDLDDPEATEARRILIGDRCGTFDPEAE